MKRKRQELTPEGRLEAFYKDLRLLDQLTRAVHKKALAADDNTAWGHLDLKCLERRAAMLALDCPTRVDMTMVAELKRPSTLDALRRSIDRMVAEGRISDESKGSRRLPSRAFQWRCASKW